KQRVAILSTNCLDMVIAIHALSYLQAVSVMVNTKLTAREITYQLKVSKAMLLIESETMQMENQIDFKAIYTYEEIWSEKELFVETAKELNLYDPFMMMITSGTTGNHKAVVHTYA